MEEDRSFMAPGHLPSRWHWPQNQQGFQHPRPFQKSARTYQYSTQAHQSAAQTNQNNTLSYENIAQGFQKNGQAYQGKSQVYPKNLQDYQNSAECSYQYNIQAYQNKAHAYQPPETYSCGPCNRTFSSQYQFDRHLQEHVECPFPECHLRAHPKAIERHIDNQHLLVNFANLQIDDEAWIAERKRRYPTSERAELRRAQQLEKAKRGEKLGKSTKPFASRGGRGGGRGRGRGRGICGANGDNGKNEKKRPGESECDAQRGRKRRKTMKEGIKDKVEENGAGGKNSVSSPFFPFREEPRRQRSARADIITVPDPDSEDETARDGIPAFRGTRHFFESTGEVSYFGTKSSGASEVHVEEEKKKELEQTEVNHISDEEDWDENGMREGSASIPAVPPTTLVLGGALGSLIGAYSDSEEDSDTPEQAPKIGKWSSTQDQTHIISKNHLVGGNEVTECGRMANKDGGRNTTAVTVPAESTTTATPYAATEISATTKTHRQHRKRRRPKKGMLRAPKRPGVPQGSFPKRRKTLLERLLLPDITRERNIILQCVRFIVKHNFLLPEQGREGGKEEEEAGESHESKGRNAQERKIEGEERERGSSEGKVDDEEGCQDEQGEEGKEEEAKEGKQKDNIIREKDRYREDFKGVSQEEKQSKLVGQMIEGKGREEEKECVANLGNHQSDNSPQEGE